LTSLKFAESQKDIAFVSHNNTLAGGIQNKRRAATQKITALRMLFKVVWMGRREKLEFFSSPHP
jgi:hypothetical protein